MNLPVQLRCEVGFPYLSISATIALRAALPVDGVRNLALGVSSELLTIHTGICGRLHIPFVDVAGFLCLPLVRGSATADSPALCPVGAALRIVVLSWSAMR